MTQIKSTLKNSLSSGLAGLALLFSSASSLAIGLDDMEVRSALGKPLLASTKVIMGEHNRDDCKVKAWRQNGEETDSSGIPSPLNLTVEWASSVTGPRIVARTLHPINDLAINVGIEVSCSDDTHLRRSYTLLLDPESSVIKKFDAQKKTMVSNVAEMTEARYPVVRAAQEIHPTTESPKSRQKSAEDAAIASGSEFFGTQLTVQEGTSIWHIARQYFKTYDERLGMVRAIRKANPSVLKWRKNKSGWVNPGTVITIPDMTVVEQEQKRVKIARLSKAKESNAVETKKTENTPYPSPLESDIVKMSGDLITSETKLIKLNEKIANLEKQIADLKRVLAAIKQ